MTASGGERPLGKLVLTCVVIALIGTIWGLSWLQLVFIQEKSQTLEIIDRQRIAVEQFASASFKQSLVSDFTVASTLIDAAHNDVLIMDTGLYLHRDGKLVLPRDSSFSTQTTTDWNGLYRQLRERVTMTSPDAEVSGQSSNTELDLTPWRALLRQRRALYASLLDNDKSASVTHVRKILSLLVNYKLDERRELVFLLAILHRLTIDSQPDPSLVKLMLQDGIVDRSGGRIDDAQRLLLRNRQRFSAQQFAYFAREIVRLGSTNHLDTSELFDKRWKQPTVSAVHLPEPEKAQPLLTENGWYLHKSGERETKGLLINTKQLVGQLHTKMQSVGLLNDNDTITVNSLGGPTLVSDLHFTLISPALAQQQRWATSLYRLKTGLLIMVLLLLAGCAVILWLMVKRKQRYLELRNQLITTLSHELKTPLASVRLMAETLHNRLADNSAAKDYPERIVKDVDGLIELIEDILTFNKIGHKGFNLQRSDLALTSLLESILQTARYDVDKPIQWRLNRLDEHTLFADPELLRILFANLVRNACLYSDKEVINIDVSVDWERNAIIFSDNSRGIPSELIDGIFDEFVSHDSRHSRGSGLGLAICQRIAQTHGGSISILDTGPQGSRFEVTLPPLRRQLAKSNGERQVVTTNT